MTDHRSTKNDIDANEVRREVVRTAVAELRTKLLDLTGRNRLLNFKHSDRGRQIRLISTNLTSLYAQFSSGAAIELRPLPRTREVSDEEQASGELEALRDADPIYLAALEEADDDPKLLREADADLARRHGMKANRARPIPSDVARATGIDPAFELPVGADREDDTRIATFIQTLLLPDAYERRLSQVRDDARSALQELGINTLACTLSFLEWFEDDNSRKTLLSPLVLFPIAIDRIVERSKYVYRINGVSEDPETNVTLLERLRRDFALVLPSYDVEEGLDVYLDSIREAIKDKPRWRVRTYATISTLNFARLSIYADLNTENSSPDNAIEDHPIVSALLAGAAERSGDASPSALPDEAFQLSLTPALITDADSSQYAAIIEAMSGKNLVIEGPPGTGKSQTITNVIAAALELGKTVLFVAEKGAALDVVKSRLDSAGLGAFCLEVHSTKARKADVHAAIRKRLELTMSTDADPRSSFESAKREADLLSQYSLQLNSHAGAIDRHLHSIVWRQERLRQDLGEHVALHFEATHVANASDVASHMLTAMIETVVAWQSRRKAMVATWGDLNRFPLGFITNPHITDDGLVQLKRAIELGVTHAMAVSDTTREFEELLPALKDTSLENALTLFSVLSKVQHLSGAPGHLVRYLDSAEDYSGIKGWVREQSLIRATLQSFDRRAVEAAETQLSALATVRALAASCGLEETTDLNAIRRQLQSAISERDRLQSLSSTMKTIEELIGIESADDPSFFASLANVDQLISATSQDVLQCRSERYARPEYIDLLKNVSDEARSHRSIREKQKAEYDLPTIVDPDEFREDSRTIRNASGLAFAMSLFFPEVKRAKERFRRRLRRPEQSISKIEMAERLSRICDEFEAMKSFEDKERYRDVLGTLFRGIETDADFLVKLATFSTQLQNISKVGAFGRPVITFFRDAATRDLDRLLAIIKGDKFIALHGMSTARRMTLVQLVDEAVKKCERLAAIESAWPTGDLAMASLNVLNNLTAAFEQRLRSNEKWRESHELRHIVPDLGALEITVLSNAIAYVDGLRSATDDPGLRQQIVSVDPVALVQLCRSQRGSDDALQKILTYKAQLEAIENLAVSASRTLSEGPMHETIMRISSIGSIIDQLAEWMLFLRIDDRLNQQGLGAFAQRLNSWTGSDIDVASADEFDVHRSLAAKAQFASPTLRDATGTILSGARARFAQADRDVMRTQSRRIRNALRRSHVDPGNGSGRASEITGLALVQREVAKQKRHVALRDLFRRSGRAIQQLMPCFMMSPLSVAQFLERDALNFDLLVIDEASQMRPEDAIGAVSRVKQAIIVGDPKQLPPSSFFARGDDVDADNEDSVDTESILELALQQFGRPRRLLWHYRSRHPGLIAFSNHEFYDDELMLFPSPIREGLAGVRLCRVDGIYHSSVNTIEAEAIANAAVAFMSEHPDMSLAIVALNQPQKEMIRAYVDKLAASSEMALAYIATWDATIEPFIVKNLESVQGDERDAVFISTVYGPDERGSVFQRFGPINSANGWRRLNVLFTRAKHRVDVFTSLRPDQVLADESSAKGVRALRNYLEYAASGRLPSGNATGREPDSDFEISVANVLRAAGFEVVPQVGVNGFFIDLGVVDPRNSARFLAGVECDGASYHSSRSARDRDRLREEILVKLGWQLVRVWSTDWFTNPRRERQRLVSELSEISKRVTDP